MSDDCNSQFRIEIVQTEHALERLHGQRCGGGAASVQNIVGRYMPKPKTSGYQQLRFAYDVQNLIENIECLFKRYNIAEENRIDFLNELVELLKPSVK